MEINLQKVNCVKCGHEWIPRVKKPAKCPRCHTYDWDTPPQKDKAEVQNE